MTHLDSSCGPPRTTPPPGTCHLRVLDGQAAVPGSTWKAGPAIGHVSRASHRHPCETQRPGDAVDPIRVLVNEVVLELVKASADRGLHFDTAVALVLERDLLARELEPLSPDLRRRLDARARATKVSSELDAAASGYVQMLDGRNPDARLAPAISGKEVVCLLPGRLWTRVAAQTTLPVQLRDSALEDAIRWEWAAILGGFTMTEWALYQLLDSAGR